jgi:hypothetical protein
MRIPFRSISATVAWLFLAGILMVGVPLFICMPLWVDTTYHDLSARNILWGGVHYRDIFETNLPGMVWITAAIRPVIGWSSEAIRIADLVVVGGTIALLWLFLKRIGISHAGRAWFVAACAFFYVYETEFIHCQRDMWMLLPTVIALHLRAQQVAAAPTASSASCFRRAVLEGVAWACAVWIKPHTLVPALFVWLASVRRLAATRRIAVADFAGLLIGGLLVGGAGTIWLIATGTWPYMWDVLLNWNQEYYRWSLNEMDMRASMVIMYFAPWSLIHLVAIPLAIAALIRARVWRIGAVEGMPAGRIDQALLAALYLGWLVQATFLQKTFHYSQAPPLLLAMAVVAAHRVPAAPILIAWCLAGGALHYYAATNDTLRGWLGQFHHEKENTFKQLVPTHKLINHEWRSVWWKCVSEGSSPELKDQLSFYRYIHCAPTWTDLDDVWNYLETLQLKDGELICWDDSTHPLYLDLKIRPGIRYMHVNTALDNFVSKRPQIRQELIDSRARHERQFVVSDIGVVRFLYDFFPTEPPSADVPELPDAFPCFCRDVFPWNQPIVRKFGRYYVHEITKPIGEIRIPHPVRINMP